MIVADVRHDQRPPRAGEVTHRVMVRVDDAAAHCEHARRNGATILMEPTDFEYGERQYAAAGSCGSHVDVHGDPRRRRARVVGRDLVVVTPER